MIERKKGIDKKLTETTTIPNTSTPVQNKSKKVTAKLNLEKEKLEEEFSEENLNLKNNLNSKIRKIKKISDSISLCSTPKSMNKMSLLTPKSMQSIKNKTNKSIISKITISNKANISPCTSRKYTSWTQNPLNTVILSQLENQIQSNIKENISFSFKKLLSLKDSEFFTKLHKLKKDINNLIMTTNQNNSNYNSSNSFDTQTFIIKFLESSIKLMTKSEELATNVNLNSSIVSDDGLINYVYYKNNSVAFDIPLKRERAMSENDEKGINNNKKKLHENFSNKRTRMTSEEIEFRMKEKLNKAEKVREKINQRNKNNLNKLMLKINDIKLKRKKEKQEQFHKLTEKFEMYNLRHQKILNEKISKVKNEHEKVAEINFLNRMEKENKDLSIIKKLNISIERRENYMKKRLDKTFERNRKEKEVDNKRKIAEIILKNKVMSKFEKNRKKIDEIEEKIKINSKIELVNKRKNQIEDRIEFLHNIYSENFIWELLEADYYDIDDILNLTSITKFELMKAKLKKDKEIIDKMYDKSIDKSKISCCSRAKTNEYSIDIENKNLKDFLNNNEDEFQNDSEDNENSPKKIKRSKSFTIFKESDFLEVDYLFKDSKTLQKKKRKKKKKPEIIKDHIIKSINSMSQSDFNTFYSKINKDKKIKKYLIKSKNGKYLKSTLIIKNEDININKKSEIDNFCNNSVNLASSDNEKENSDKDNSMEEKEKLMRQITQTTDILNKDSNSNTIILNSESLSNILEKNQINLKWCKLCNMILPADQETSTHISKLEHRKLKTEYGISLQDDSTLIIIFQSMPGDISEDLKNERINAIKLRLKKVKQKLSLKAVKHENFWSYKQDFPSSNKQRLQKISFDIEKSVFPIIKDYDNLESMLKDQIKILEQKKQNDLHIMRQLKVIHCLVEILKKPPVCHKSEIKNLGKIIDLVVKILMYFSTIIENRNYMIVTNRVSVIADLLLWVLNKPSKIPLGISFLPDTIYLITIHIKHRIPFEYLAMKDDFIEFMFISNIMIKFKQKYISLVGPIDLTSGFGSFPLVLLKSLGMIEALTSQLNINYCSKPVYVKNTKISENILFVLEYTELVGTIHLLTTLLLSNGPVKSKTDKSVVLPQTVISASILGVKVLNNIARLDLSIFQNVCNNSLLIDQLFHILNYIIHYSLEYSETSDDLKELLHEVF